MQPKRLTILQITNLSFRGRLPGQCGEQTNAAQFISLVETDQVVKIAHRAMNCQ
jgi:hypothetical protein